MADITGVDVKVTEQSGEGLCDNTPCGHAPCLNGATCADTNASTSGYECTCAAGYEGVNCELDVDECSLGTFTTYPLPHFFKLTHNYVPYKIPFTLHTLYYIYPFTTLYNYNIPFSYHIIMLPFTTPFSTL